MITGRCVPYPSKSCDYRIGCYKSGEKSKNPNSIKLSLPDVLSLNVLYLLKILFFVRMVVLAYVLLATKKWARS